MVDPKANRLEISGPGLREICYHLHENGTNSDRSENFSSRSSKRDESRPVCVQCRVGLMKLHKKEMYGGRYEFAPV